MTTFELFGEIGWEVTLDEVKNIVNSNKNEDITFVISSLGGDPNTGIAIHDLIKSHKGKTVAKIIGMTASAGTPIALACDEVEMSENALFLIHNAWGFFMGNAEELEKMQDSLEKIDDILVNIYTKKTGKSEDEIRNLMAEEIWLSASEAEEWGFIDTILEDDLKIAASYNPKLLPKNILNKLENKMNIFKNSKKTYIWNTKDGKQILASAEEPAEGVEVAAVGEETIENEVELEGGEKVTVEDGKVTAVEEGEAATDQDEIVNAVTEAVSDILAEELKTLRAEIDERFKAIKTAGSKATVQKDKGVFGNREDKDNDIVAKMRGKIKTQFANYKNEKGK